MAIARLFVKNPPIVLLDAATSALDSRTEADIQGALAALSSDRTSVTIAHRLGTISNCDSIIVLNSGRITERGSPREPVGSGGRVQGHVGRAGSEFGGRGGGGAVGGRAPVSKYALAVILERGYHGFCHSRQRAASPPLTGVQSTQVSSGVVAERQRRRRDSRFLRAFSARCLQFSARHPPRKTARG